MPRTAFLLLFVGGVYFVAGKLGLALASVHPSATAIWPPTGIAVAAFLFFGSRVWPAVMVGAFFVNSTTAGSLATSAMIAVGNTLEAAVGAALARRFAGGVSCLDRGRDVFRFAILTGLLATTVSPSIGVTSLVASGFAERSDFGRVWLTWWLGDVGGVLVVAPVLLLWARDPAIRWNLARGLEAVGLLASTVALGLLVFRGLPAFAESRYPLSYLCFPPLLWAAFRFGPREAATCVFLLSVVAAWGTLQGFGTFAVGTPNHSLVLLDAFLTVASLTSLGLAAVVHERKKAAMALEEAEKRLQQLLRGEQEQRIEAEATSRAKDQFLAILGHELRSPLSALAHATAAVQQLPARDADAEHLHVMIERQTRYLTRLVNDLLEISRLDSGKVGLRREPLDLRDIAERTLASFKLSGRLASHEVSTTLASVPVRADPTRMEQIVRNLLENAVQYTPPGGRIELALAAAAGEARLRVVDDGRGIDARTLPHIFDFFAQADDALDRSHGGLGIGLTIARRLVEMHGGSIEARSEGRNRGCEFLVRLPLEDASPTARQTPTRDSASTAARSLRILVVEDYDDARNTLRELLEVLGHSVETAADGMRGVEVALAWRPDVALVDIGLPKLDGYAVAEKIRASDTDRRVYLVAVTGYGQPEVQKRALDSGFDECLVKPVDPAELTLLLATRARVRTPAADPARAS